MSRSVASYLRGGLSRTWRFIDASRRAVLNLIFLAIVLALLFAFFGGGAKPLGNKTMLVLNLNGQLVEQTPGGAKLAALANLDDDDRRRFVQLRDVLRVLDAAARDPQIAGAVLVMDEMEGGGQAMLREIAAGIDRFKASGKTVVAWGSSYNQRQYQVAAHASEVYLHPMGAVILDGFGQYRNYYRDALDKVGVTVNLIKVGTFKSAAEPFIGNGPSEAAREADAYLNNDLWARYMQEVETVRKLPKGTITRTIDTLPEGLQAVGGDLAKLAQQVKLVDGLKTRDQIRELVLQRGMPDAEGKSFRQVGFDEYLARLRQPMTGDAIGVVMAVGEIGDGIAPPGSIGGLSTANLIRLAREDKDIKAIVLRVDSPGGSAFGSELIRRELELTRAAGKPVVVSMGNVAASGGYWISMAADEVIADPTTITGSIGVFALFPTVDKVMDKVGIHSAGQPTTWLGDAGNPTRPLDPRFGQVLQASVSHVYGDFTRRVALARKSTPEKIDAVAQGRIWTGAQAKERGLVDTLGSFGDALKSAARRAKLTGGTRVVYIERAGSKFDKLVEFFGGSAAQAVAKALTQETGVALAPTGMPLGVATDVARELTWLNEMTDHRKPFMTLTHCLCTSPQ
ncbi:signal peptide peptidase SppA [Pseudoduganella chitinolytica]|uniref:Signal peptide peptidase SppA n=1 Tax=Pseudoduganella chitinolytica TaxID=34070 RepID=A0ABY8BCP8_9BURK|nr:signal peptide peptidase SppA [Pseudoduganella chitinolytica]WEF33677.1 signal peptide peptidase SppA [Pseudoduganella chitinolytica]